MDPTILQTISGYKMSIQSFQKMLLELIQGVTLEKNKITIEPEIIIRDSCDQPSQRRRV